MSRLFEKNLVPVTRHAVAAHPEEVHGVALDPAVRAGLGFRLQIRKRLKRQIRDRTAPAADKMIMGAGVGVKMILPVADSDPANLAQVYEKIQVPVDGSQADVGKFLTDARVYGVCCRMVVTAHQACFDGFPLTAILQCFHKTAPLGNSNSYHIYNIEERGEKVKKNHIVSFAIRMNSLVACDI